MQSVVHNPASDNVKEGKNEDKSSTPKGQSLDRLQTNFMADLSESEDDEVSEVDSFIIEQGDLDEEPVLDTSKFLLASEDNESPDLRSVDPETQARLEALLEAAGIGKLATADGKHFADPEVLRKLTSSVSCALDEAAAALTKMRTDNPEHQNDGRSLAEACGDGDVGAVRKLLDEGRSVHETTEEGESLLSLACSAGYFELAQVLLAMRANVEDRGIKGDCTPLMEAASCGHVDIVRLLIAHGADVNAQSSSGNTPLMYACAAGYEEAVKVLLEAGSNVEDHNENGHTPLMEAASAGHVGVASLLLQHGAGINTHSNEFKESALTLACYKGHLEMVRFLLEAGADQEHKTDEMHTALMEASMDGHTEVARLLLDSGAQVNMPADSFESPLTLAACGGHVELAMLLLERGANIEEVNDEGYTPLMEAAREGHEEMVALLLSQGADINAQTEETQETALTLACCGGFLEVADFLIKAGADLELGASTPLMESAQEGHLDLVRYLLDAGASVHAQTQTGDTALTYACENGHTDVADLLLQAGADLEHESEGGRTPLMKAARAGHLCTVQFLISRGADVNRQTTNNDHTPLSLACAGGHLAVVELLLAHGADPAHQLKDNSTMLIEASKGGHIGVAQLLLDYPHNLMTSSPPPDLSQLTPPNMDVNDIQAPRVPPHGLQVVVPQDVDQSQPANGAAAVVPNTHNYNYMPRQLMTGLPDTFLNMQDGLVPGNVQQQGGSGKQGLPKCFLRNKNNNLKTGDQLSSAELQQIKNTPQAPLSANLPPDLNYDAVVEGFSMDMNDKYIKRSDRFEACLNSMMMKAEMRHSSNRDDQIYHKQQILEELHKVERELQQKTQSQLLLNSPQQRFDANIAKQDDFTTTATTGQSGNDVSAVANQSLEMSQVAVFGDLTGGHHLHLTDPSSAPYLQPPVTPAQSSREKGGNGAQPFVVLPLDEEQLKSSESSHLHNPEALQTLSLKAIAQSNRAGILADTLQAAAQMTNIKLAAGLSVPVFDPNTASSQALSLAVASAAQNITCMKQNKNQLDAIDSNMSPHVPGYVDDLPVDSSVSLAMASDVISPTPITLTHSPTTGPFVDEGLMVAAPARTLQETLGTITGSVLHLNQQQALNQQVAQQFITTNNVATQCIDQSLHPPTSTAMQLPYVNGPVTSTPTTVTSSTVPAMNTPTAQIPLQPLPSLPALNINSQTDSNRDTALTLACAGGHDDLVQLLLSRGSNLEHRDKKGFTPLILAATAGHARAVEILLNHGADIEAQSERTKDTPLSLACSGGRYEVVEILLARNANKEHRNVSDYTPLSLAASGGYVNVIKLLLNYGAEINSRTNSKLGISPLMLAAMNGHTAAVKLLLDNGGDINAQIETNRNTALTLACFQGRHEVVSLLVDRKANVEHRAKTGLTPLMEAASGGYVDVGRVLLDKGADVNAPPVPSSRDTALTIAADKGHYRFVELLLSRGAQVDVKNKKGNSPLWLAANGGHLDVVQLLVSAGADIDSQDNRKVSCLMSAFRKGHVKVVKWMVRHVSQFPSDQEMTRFIATITDKELLKKCHQCMENIRVAKDRQAVEANKYATILLEELDMEKTREESKKAAAARRRERKRKKKKEKQEKKMLLEENKKNESKNDTSQDGNQTSSVASSNEDESPSIEPPSATTTTTIGTMITTTTKASKQVTAVNPKNLSARLKNHISTTINKSHDSCARKGEATNNAINSSLVNLMATSIATTNKRVSTTVNVEAKNHTATVSVSSSNSSVSATNGSGKDSKEREKSSLEKERKEKKTENVRISNKETKVNNKEKEIRTSEGGNKARVLPGTSATTAAAASRESTSQSSRKSSNLTTSSTSSSTATPNSNKRKKNLANQYHTLGDLDDFSTPRVASSNSKSQKGNQSTTGVSGNGSNRKNDLSSCGTISNNLVNSLKSPPVSVASPKRGNKREEGWKEVVRRSKKVLVPSTAISRVIGRGGCNINAIREVSGAHIEVEKQKGAGDRTVIIKGSAESTRQAHQLICALIKDPEQDLLELLPRALSTKGSVPVVKTTSAIGTSQATTMTTNSSQLKVSAVVKVGAVVSTSSASSLSSSSSSSSSASSLSLSSRVGHKSIPSNPTIGIYSAPPFPATQQTGNLRHPMTSALANNSRPGIPVSPLGSAFGANMPAWSSTTAAASVATSAPNSSPQRVVPARANTTVGSTTDMSPLTGGVVGDASNNKSAAVRQLFPLDKRSTVLGMNTTSTSNVKTAALIAQPAMSKNMVTPPTANSNSFASKLTKTNKLATATALSSTVQSMPNTITSPAIRPAQSTPNINQSPISSAVINSTSRTPPQAMQNGAIQQPIGTQQRSQPSTPTSSAPFLQMSQNNTNNNSNIPMPKVSTPQEYSPFNSFFSQVAQQSVWGKEKDDNGRGMNFASVAASSVKPIGSLNQSNVSMVPLPCNKTQHVDAAKAPGYRGNSHISPNSCSNVQIAIANPNPMSNSAPASPPLGPIGPPNALSINPRRSPSPLVRTPAMAVSQMQCRVSPAESPALSPVLSSSAPVGSSFQMSLANLSRATQQPLPSPGGGANNQTQQNLMVCQQGGKNMTPAPNNRPLQQASTPNFVSVSSLNPSPRFTAPPPPTTNLQNHLMAQQMNNSKQPAIHSNLNPNAPDFSSQRTQLVGNNAAQVNFLLNRMTAFGDGPAPNMSAFRPMNAPGNTFPGPIPPPLPQGLNRHPFLMAAPKQMPQSHQPPPPPPPQVQGPTVNEMAHANHLPNNANLHVAEQVRLNAVNFTHRQAHYGNGGVMSMPQSMGSQGVNAAALTTQQFLMQSGQMMLNQRSGNNTPSKDEGSPITTISPVGSPSSSNPSSPTGMSVSRPNDHQAQMKAIGEDRKFLRPIGTERAHRKTPVFNSGVATPDVGASIWSFPSADLHPDWISSASETANEQHEQSIQLMPQNYLARFANVEGMGAHSDNNNPNLEQHYQQQQQQQQHQQHQQQQAPIVHPGQISCMGMNASPYPQFMNGMPPQVLSQLYGTIGASNSGHVNEMWPNAMKMGGGDSVLPPNSQGSTPASHAFQEPKAWNNWSQLQM